MADIVPIIIEARNITGILNCPNFPFKLYPTWGTSIPIDTDYLRESGSILMDRNVYLVGRQTEAESDYIVLEPVEGTENSLTRLIDKSILSDAYVPITMSSLSNLFIMGK